MQILWGRVVQLRVVLRFSWVNKRAGEEDEQSIKVVCKSFADCNISEMSLAIEACNQIAEEQGIKLG